MRTDEMCGVISMLLWHPVTAVRPLHQNVISPSSRAAMQLQKLMESEHTVVLGREEFVVRSVHRKTGAEAWNATFRWDNVRRCKPHRAAEQTESLIYRFLPSSLTDAPSPAHHLHSICVQPDPSAQLFVRRYRLSTS